MRFTSVVFFVFIINSSVFSQNNPSRIKAAHNQLSIVLPDGFEQSKNFSGFINRSSASSILLYQLNTVGYMQYLDSLSPAYFDSQNLVVNSRIDIKESNLYGKLIECQYQVDTLWFNRVFFIAGNDSETTLFLINYPSSMDAEMKTVVLETIRSIKHE